MKRFHTYLLIIAGIFVIGSMFACCSAVPRLKCEHTTNIPVTYIGLDSVARTVYVPWCDTLRQLPPKPKEKVISNLNIDVDRIDTELPAEIPPVLLLYKEDPSISLSGSAYIPASRMGAWWLQYANKGNYFTH